MTKYWCYSRVCNQKYDKHQRNRLRDSISTLVDCRILINKKTKEDLDLLFVNEYSSTDNSSQRHNFAFPDIAPVALENPNCSLIETSKDIDSDKYNDLKSEVNSKTTSFAALKKFIVDELNEIIEKVITRH